MANEFFEKKIRTLFTRFDLDNNGKIEIDDIKSWGIKLTKSAELNEPKSEELIQNLLQLWFAFFLPADLNSDGSVEYSELLDYMQSVFQGDQIDSFKQDLITKIFAIIFDAIDTNLDGSIASPEFIAYFASLNIDDVEFSINTFNAIDTNNDGELSKEEFVKFGNQFFMSSDEHDMSKYVFGPIV